MGRVGARSPFEGIRLEDEPRGEVGLTFHVEEVAGLTPETLLAQESEAEILLGLEPWRLDDGGSAAVTAQHAVGRMLSLEDEAESRDTRREAPAAWTGEDFLRGKQGR